MEDNRGSCCNGSASCSLNQIVAKVDDIFRIYDNNKEHGKKALDNLLLHMDEELEGKTYHIARLQARLHRREL